MKKLICLLLTLLMSVGCLCACRDDKNEPPGELYSLEEAYEQGLITKNDLMNIAYYQNGNKLFEEVENFTPSPKNPETLSEETENAIKETLVNNLRKQTYSNGKLVYSNVSISDVRICGYYGTYNGVVAIKKADNFSGYSQVEKDKKIGGVTFRYTGPFIVIWKQNK